MKIFLTLLATLTGIIVGFANSIETPGYIGETNVLLFVSICNLLWVIPYYIYHQRKDDKDGIRHTLVLLSIALIPFVVAKVYARPFNSEKWKAETRNTGTYVTHNNGGMVENLISSKVLVGLSRQEVENKLGTHYFKLGYVEKDNMCYWYTNGTFWDGCDKVLVILSNGFCTHVEYNGCD